MRKKFEKFQKTFLRYKKRENRNLPEIHFGKKLTHTGNEKS